jgi:gamma-butyrobetaine dioxygenase
VSNVAHFMPERLNASMDPQIWVIHLNTANHHFTEDRYTTNPPHLQLLHSLRARAPGGESLFSDALHAAHRLWALNSDHFKTLSSYPVPYQYKNDSQHYQYLRPTFEVDHAPLTGRTNNPPLIHNINWSPPFQGPIPLASSMISPSFRDYHAAAAHFGQLIEAPDALYEYRLAEGDCVVFDNRRVLHARRAFDAEKGERWLKGAYVDNDVFFSKLRVMEETFGQ